MCTPRGLIPILMGTFFFSSSCTTPIQKLSQQVIPPGDSLIGELRTQRFELQNGLKVLIVEDSTSPTFAYQTWYDVGSKHDETGKTGLAHFFEHLMFQETKNYARGQIRRIAQTEGAVGFNAFTGKDYTGYVQQLPRAALDLIASLESERMRNLVINQKAFESEIEVIHNERRMRYENNPSGMMAQALSALAYQNHPYGQPIIGYKKDLESLQLQDARDFYDRFYAPNRATIVIVGDVKYSEVKETIQKHYGKIPRGPNRLTKPSHKWKVQKKPKRKMISFRAQNQKLRMAYHVPELTHPDQPALEVLQALLTDGRTSRLRKTLVDSGIASHVGSGTLQNAEPSLFIFSASLQTGKAAASAEKIILRELKKLESSRIDRSELDRAKNLVQFLFYQRLVGNHRKARFLGSFEVKTGDFKTGLELYQQIPDVSQEDIRRVVKTYFSPSQRSVIIGQPKEES